MSEIISIKDMMAIDREKLLEKPTREIKANRLSAMIGKKVTVKVSAISGRKYSTYLAPSIDNKDKLYDCQARIVAAGVVDPDLNNTELQKHFGVATSSDLVKVLFPGGEMVQIFNTIAELSGYLTPEDEETPEEEAKN